MIRRPFHRLHPLVTLLAAFVVAGCGIGGTAARAATGPVTAASCLANVTGGPYVRSNGRSLVCGASPLALTGYTFYPALAGGSKAWHSPGFTQYIDQMLAMGAAAGQNLVRPTDQWDKNTQGQTAWDATVWANMDYLVAAAQRRHMYVVVDVSAYRWLLESEGADPWTASNWTSFLTSVATRYRDTDAVAFYSISGEPDPPHTDADLQHLLDFYRATTAAIRAADPNHLITVGGFNHMEDSPALNWWQSIDALPGNDIVAIKTYSQRDVNLMPAIASYARSVNRPVVEDEFGMPQGYGDAAFAGGATYNGLAAGRAPFFQTVYQNGQELGYAAFIFWNLGCETGNDSYEVNPGTPATWSVVKRFGAAPAAPEAATSNLCG